jgi:2-polyprenyl-6-methoxyphenol hydroxylase-like FAD-dependent oxidoreductase
VAEERTSTRCVVAGGGPAGIVLGLLLGRAGVPVLVLEKHADFLRDFRGDTIHPSTLELAHELGFLDRLLRLPHQEWGRMHAQVGAEDVEMATLRRLPTRCRFVAMMPQWDFLSFLAREAERFPAFALRMSTEVEGVLEEGGRVVGVRASAGGVPLEVRADLVVAADGRGSRVRAAAGLEVEDLGAPIDVLWFRVSRGAADPPEPLLRVEPGRWLVMFDRVAYWQCAFVIRKGAADDVRARGLDAFRRDVAALVPWLADRVGEMASWDDVRLLTVRVDRLRRWWRPGLLCLGDAAHAMSPIGGVGINLAIQDAVAAANRLVPAWRRGAPGDDDLEAVQRRRWWPTAATQRIQVLLQDRMISRVVSDAGSFRMPLPFRLLKAMPPLRHLTARLIGIGLRPEHVRTPSVAAGRAATGNGPALARS